MSCSTSTPINHRVFFFFCRIPVVLENRGSCQRGGAQPLHPSPRSSPGSGKKRILTLVLFQSKNWTPCFNIVSQKI